MQYAYDDEESVETNIAKVACNLYGASIITYSAAARKKLKHIVCLLYTSILPLPPKFSKKMKTDIEIARSIELVKIKQVARETGIPVEMCIRDSY